MSKERAKLAILSELFSFPTIRDKDWTTQEPEIGDLITISCLRPSKWYVSWVREIRQKPHSEREFLLESIEDGELCWWSNIQTDVYNRERSNNPLWQWTDKQVAFNDRWFRSCKEAYLVLPVAATFQAENAVTLDVRIRHSWSNYSNPHTFSNWKKLTMKTMRAYFAKCVKEYDMRGVST